MKEGLREDRDELLEALKNVRVALQYLLAASRPYLVTGRNAPQEHWALARDWNERTEELARDRAALSEFTSTPGLSGAEQLGKEVGEWAERQMDKGGEPNYGELSEILSDRLHAESTSTPERCTGTKYPRYIGATAQEPECDDPDCPVHADPPSQGETK